MFKKKPTEAHRGRQRLHTDNQTRPAFSYHAQRQRADDGNPRARQRPDASIQLQGSSVVRRAQAVLRANIIWAVGTVAILLLLVANAFVSVQNPKVIVHGTPDQRMLLQSNKVYESEARSLLTASPLYRLKLTADTDAFGADFTKKHPELASARLHLALFGQQPEVHITPATPVLELISSSNQTYIIDSVGRVIQAAEPGKLALPRLQDQSGFQIREGSQALSSKDISFIIRLQNQLVAKDVQVKAFVIPPSSRQLQVQLEGKSYLIKFTFEHDVLQQAGAYIAVQQKLDSLGTAPAEYIDVRVADRAYYK